MSEIKVNSIKGVAASAAAITVNNTDGTCTANITNNLSNRNLIINGGMKVAQRGTSTQLLYNYAGPDRFRLGGDGGQRSTISSDSITVDSKGQSNAYKLDVTTANASPASGHNQIISYRFEGQDLQHLEKGTSNAKPLTLQFWVKSPKTGVHIVELVDQSNSSRHINKSYTISSANTWQKVEITFEGDTTGAITNDNARRLDLNFWLMAGSTYTSGTLQTSWGSDTNANRAVGQVNVVDNTSNEFYLTGVQLEVGSVATDFEHRSFAQELQLCKRYFQKMERAALEVYCTGYFEDSTQGRYALVFPVDLRADPSITFSAASTFTNIHTGSLGTGTSMTTTNTSPQSAFVNCTVNAGGTDGQACLLASGVGQNSSISISAEL